MSKFKETMSTIPLQGLILHSITDLHPVQSEVEYGAMKVSIEEQGQTVPIITYRGKVVDGRHRVKAMRELGLTHITSIALNPKQTLADVRRKVVGVEARRGRTGPQKAIQAYLECESNPDMSRDEAALAYMTTTSDISLVSKIVEFAGVDIVKRMLRDRKVIFGEKTYTDLRKLKHATKPQDPNNDKNIKLPPEILAIISSVDDIEEMMNVHAVLNHCKRLIKKSLEL